MDSYQKDMLWRRHDPQNALLALGKSMNAEGNSALERLFPESDRVAYAKAPLAQVVCQLSFPHLLAIGSQPPVSFQECIRQFFPILERGVVMPPLEHLPPEVVNMFRSQAASGPYQFLSEDRTQTLTLMPDAMTFAVNIYTGWPDFYEALAPAIAALATVYRPSFFNRIGLRYVNAINREELGLGQRSWSDLLRSELLNQMIFPDFEDRVESVGTQIQLGFPENEISISLRHGYGLVTGKPGISYLVDFDYYKDTKTEVSNVENYLRYFNRISGSAFRWCILDALHDAMEPNVLGR